MGCPICNCIIVSGIPRVIIVLVIILIILIILLTVILSERGNHRQSIDMGQGRNVCYRCSRWTGAGLLPSQC